MTNSCFNCFPSYLKSKQYILPTHYFLGSLPVYSPVLPSYSPSRDTALSPTPADPSYSPIGMGLWYLKKLDNRL